MSPTLHLTGEFVFFWYVVVPSLVLAGAVTMHLFWHLAWRRSRPVTPTRAETPKTRLRATRRAA